jgi:hypothetical protein
VQIAVSLADTSLNHTALQHGRLLRQETLDERLDRLIEGRREYAVDKGRHLGEVLLPVRAYCDQTTVFIHTGAGGRVRVEAGDPPGDAAYQTGVDGIGGEHVRQHPRLG